MRYLSPLAYRVCFLLSHLGKSIVGNLAGRRVSAVLSALFTLITALTAAPSWAAPAPTTTTLTIASSGSAVTSVVSGTVVTLTATVVSGSKPAHLGQVKFCDAAAKYCEDSALLATAQLTTAGTAAYKFRPGPGSHSYQAVFVGTGGYAKSTSTAASLTVPVPYPTTTAMASSGSPGNYSLTATVSGSRSAAPGPTGKVSFLDTTNGNASLGEAALGTATLGEGFTTASMPVGANTPRSVVVGDFNGDGIPDMATNEADSFDSEVSVFLGNGDGTFTLKPLQNIGNEPFAIAVGDFNGDGILDLAVTNWAGDSIYVDGSTVTVALGNGDGTFTTKATVSVGNEPGSIVVGDFNGDGIVDLAVGNEADGTVTVLLGKGDGTFTTKSTLPLNIPAGLYVDIPIAVGDFNRDGIQDLAISNVFDNTVTVWLGNGDGTFTTTSATALSDTPLSIAVGDFNGDGIPDLSVAISGGNGNIGSVAVLLGNGDGTFTTKSAPSVPSYPLSIAVSDFNGDGILDLATATCASPCDPNHTLMGTVTVMLGKGDGTFVPQSPVNVGQDPTSIAVGDFNGDGISDLATSNLADGTVTVLLNQLLTETSTATLSNVSVSGAETHQIVASYPGDTNYSASTSNTLPLLAEKVATTLTLTSSLNPAPYGVNVILTVTLTPYSFGTFNTDGETVTIYNGKTVLFSVPLSAGVVSFSSQSIEFPLPAGTYTFTASYPGDSSFAAATSNSLVQIIEPLVASPVINPSFGASSGPVTVTITDTTPNAAIYYTLNGQTPSTSSTLYTGPFQLNLSPSGTSAVFVIAIAVAPNYGQSGVASVYYYYVPGVAEPLISPPTGTYTSPQTAMITDATPGATIYYTTNGSTPNRSSAVYSSTSPISVTSTEVIKALAVAPGDLTSPEAVATYNIIPPYAATPTFSLAPGFYLSAQTVGLSDATAGATIHYTTNGSTPTTSSPVFMPGSPIAINTDTQVKAIAVAPGYSNSAVAIGNFYVAAAEPLISPPTGRYSGTEMVTITDTTPGAIIYYTTNGTTPSRSSLIFNPASPITVNSSQTIKALAIAPGYTTSPEGVASYTIGP